MYLTEELFIANRDTEKYDISDYIECHELYVAESDAHVDLDNCGININSEICSTDIETVDSLEYSLITAKGLAAYHPEHNKRYSLDNMGDGYLFADCFRDVARYVTERKKWYIYDGKVWKGDIGELKVMEMCKALASNLMVYANSLKDGYVKDKYRNHVSNWAKRQHRETVLKDAKSVYAINANVFDSDPHILNCLNGTLNLITMEFYRHTPSDMLTMISGVNYDPNTRCERWVRFISEIMEDNMEKATFLQKSLGYALTGDTSRECFFILYGATTRNGKGTTMETFMKIMGDYGKTANPESIAQKQKANGSAPSEDIARLAGARFVNISEPDKKMELSTALVKTLTGNDTITARFLNENSFEFIPQFKIFINTNYLPTATDSTLFSSGRCYVITFDRHFGKGEQDKGLKSKLSEPLNLSGIFNWCIEGLHLAKETGFQSPQCVIDATEQYRRDNDKIAHFISDEMETGANFESKTTFVYTRYQKWCELNGKICENYNNFLSALRLQAFVDRKRPSTGGEKTTLVLGYRLKYEDGAADANENLATDVDVDDDELY